MVVKLLSSFRLYKTKHKLYYTVCPIPLTLNMKVTLT